MPNKEFLEQYPLCKRFAIELPATTNILQKVRINMPCETCSSHQTFEMTNEYWQGETASNIVVGGRVVRVLYRCTHCQSFDRAFLIKFDPAREWLMKVGQFPPWDIEGDPNIAKLLGKNASYYRRGLICESQGYGIGAFGYYRRIVEEVIDELLDEISYLLAGDELTKYQEALQRTKKTIVAQEKIDVVKDLLPPILRPDGMNPLSVLHSSLSEGLHAGSDEECLEYARECREVLVFLTTQVAASKATGKSFTDSMRKLLERKKRPAN